MPKTVAQAQRDYIERRKAVDPDGLREDLRLWHARYRRDNPEKKAAWNAVYIAVRSGRLERADRCERCDVECRTEASHDDYSRRLDVEWLCRSCHVRKDRKGE